jgi:putative phage-type endonuclease
MAEEWCDEYLPELYDPAMYDEEETSEAVWEAVEKLAADTVLEHIDDSAEREELSDELTEAARDWFRAHHDLILESIPAAPPTALLSRPQIAQHSADWYTQRSHRLTASEFAQILDGRRAALMRAKLFPPASDEIRIRAPVGIAQPDGELPPTTWGHRFERLTRQIYEQEIAGPDTVCDTLGRFQHAVYPWLSASPDGVVLSGPVAGRLVEIKSPKSRQPGEFVPSDYYAQMQIQMEVCDVDAVDFVEAQFAQRPVRLAAYGGSLLPAPADDGPAIAAAPWKGRIQVWGQPEDPASWCYRYTAPVEDLDDATWDGSEPEPPAPAILLEESVWWLTGWYPRTVLRNRSWWEETAWPAAAEFWAELESQRASATALRVLTVTDTDTIELVGGGWAGRN